MTDTDDLREQVLEMFCHDRGIRTLYEVLAYLGMAWQTPNTPGALEVRRLLEALVREGVLFEGMPLSYSYNGPLM